MRVAFLGSPPFATPVFAALLASEHEVVALVTPPDRPRGRGQRVPVSPLADLALDRGRALLRPETTRGSAFLAELARTEPEVIAVASYGEILRPALLDLPPHGCLNVHASLLPRWRGASPVQAAIRAGDERTGVTIQRIVAALDEGDVLLERSTPIDPAETAGQLTARLAALGGPALVEALDRLARGEARFTPQDPAAATYARKLSKADGLLDWTLEPGTLARFVRAMTPWPGARTTLPEERELVVLAARPAEGIEAPPAAAPGTLLDARGRLYVACGGAVLELLRVKPAGRAAMDGEAFLRGARLPPDTVFGTV